MFWTETKQTKKNTTAAVALQMSQKEVTKSKGGQIAGRATNSSNLVWLNIKHSLRLSNMYGRQAGLTTLGLWFKLGGTNKTAECQFLSEWCNEKVSEDSEALWFSLLWYLYKAQSRARDSKPLIGEHVWCQHQQVAGNSSQMLQVKWRKLGARDCSCEMRILHQFIDESN